IILAIGYPKTGALVSLVGTVEQRVYEKMKFYHLKEKNPGDLEEGLSNIQRSEQVLVEESEEIESQTYTSHTSDEFPL
ncbi:7881_t:CDS:1, partial [Paraglomus occultum]